MKIIKTTTAMMLALTMMCGATVFAADVEGTNIEQVPDSSFVITDGINAVAIPLATNQQKSDEGYLTSEATETYTVTFECNGGSNVSAQNIRKNGLLVKPADPTKQGYLFAGWYRNENLTTAWNFSAHTVTANSVLYAKWDKTQIEENTAAVNTTYRTAIQNIGWQELKKDGELSGTTGKSWRLEAIEIATNSSANVGVQYRTHIQNKGWLPWVADGVTSGTTGESLRMEAIQIQLTGADANQYDIYYQVHAENFGWLGWAKNGESAGTAGYGYRLESIRVIVVKKDSGPPTTTTEVPYKEKNSSDNSGGTGNVINNYRITFRSNGGTAISDGAVVSGGLITEPTPPTKSGYVFGGWYKDRNLTIPWNFAADTVTKTTSLYARWIAEGSTDNGTDNTFTKYRITFRSNGGTAILDGAVASGGLITEPTPPTKSGYVFGGWYKDRNLVTPWNFATDTVVKTTSLYAKWTAEGSADSGTDNPATKYRVTFRTNGGTAIPFGTVASGGLITEPAPPIKSGFVFGGWYKDRNLASPWNFASDAVTKTTSLYAKWNTTN